MPLLFFVGSQRTRYLNAVNTFKELLSMGVVPIVNENDTISVSVRHLSSLQLCDLVFAEDLTKYGIFRRSNSATTTHCLP